MANILKFGDYSISEERALEMIDFICNPVISESSESNDDFSFRTIAKKLSKDIKFNFGLVVTFGTGIGMMIPIVNRLIANGNLSFEPTQENIILLCITTFSVVYLEETSNKAGDAVNSDGKKSLVTKTDVQTMLEELRMRGLGQGIVKKFVSVFRAIGKFFKLFFRATPYVINGFLDMFGYTSLLLPCMNALAAYLGKYDLTIDTVTANLLTVGAGFTALVAKNGVNWLVHKLKKSLNIKDAGVEAEMPINQYGLEGDLDKSKLIKEQ